MNPEKALMRSVSFPRGTTPPWTLSIERRYVKNQYYYLNLKQKKFQLKTENEKKENIETY